MKKKINLIIVFVFLICTYFFADYVYKSEKLKNFTKDIHQDKKEFIKKFIFPFRTIDKLKEQINLQDNQFKTQKKKIEEQKRFLFEKDLTIDVLKDDYPNFEDELLFKQSGENITYYKKEGFELSNNIILKKFYFLKGFYSGIANKFPGSGYIDFHGNNLFVLSARGLLGYTKTLDDNMKFIQINNNLNDYLSLNQFKKSYDKYPQLSFKDLTIHNNKIYISFTEEIENNCWNTSILISEINYEKLNFEKLFSSNNCVHPINNIDRQFNAAQSGGRIVGLDDNNILLTVGEYRSRYLAQEKESINGKIIKININNSSYKIISMGHRNQQGLYFDKQNQFILETEHGPKGGDEINIIYLDKLESNVIPNYGWPLASYGVHYHPSHEKKYPLYKSHSEYGFVEPIKYFTPSIGISEITKIDYNFYVVSSLKEKTLYTFNLSDKKEIQNIIPIHVGERIRDIKLKDKKLFMFLEDTASIAYIDFN